MIDFGCGCDTQSYIVVSEFSLMLQFVAVECSMQNISNRGLLSTLMIIHTQDAILLVFFWISF
jgi:hypothetical protein